MPADGDAWQLAGLGVKLARLAVGNAELVLRLAGGDLGVRLGVDVGIDAQRHVRGVPEAFGDLAQRAQLGLALDVEAEDALLQRVGHLLARLADTGEDDLVRRHAGGEGAAQLALGDDIHAGAELGERAQHRLVGVGLDGIADERVLPGEGFRQHAVVPLQRRRRIAIEGRAHLGGEARERDILGVQHAVLVMEMVHGGLLSPRFGLAQQRIENEAVVRLGRGSRIGLGAGSFGRLGRAGSRRRRRGIERAAHAARAEAEAQTGRHQRRNRRLRCQRYAHIPDRPHWLNSRNGKALHR